MPEKQPIQINLKGSDKCGFEGVGERPNDCKNNPIRHPDTHRPQVCLECPLIPGITKVAEAERLPEPYFEFKRTRKKSPIDKQK